MKIYVLTFCWYDQYRILGTYKSYEGADNERNRLVSTGTYRDEELDIEQFELQD